jgi:CubicO group peptidase (beta-lactamase class C family)
MVMSLSFQHTRERIEDQVDEGLFTPGAQMVVHLDGERALDVAIGGSGMAEPMTPDHIFRVYCTIKPITAVAVAHLVDAGAVDLDEPLGPRLPEFTRVGSVTLRHVLNHTAGLLMPQGLDMELRTPERRRESLLRARQPRGWRIGIDAGYSEYVSWHMLGALLERTTGEPLREYLRSTVMDPLGLTSTWIGMTPEQYERMLPRLGVNADMHDLRSIPMLFERIERVCTETNPSHGGYTNARDLATFYSAMLDRLAGGGNDALPSSATLEVFTSPARPVSYDDVLIRECSYGLGFMTDLREHAFGDLCSESSFGHSGNLGTSFAFADPQRGLAVGVVFNGLVSHEAAFLRRRALVNALYTDLDEHDAALADEMVDETAAEPTEGAQRSRFGFRRRVRK